MTLVSGFAALGEGRRLSTYGEAGGPDTHLKGSELPVLKGTWENKSEGLGGRAGLGPADKSEWLGAGLARPGPAPD